MENKTREELIDSTKEASPTQWRVTEIAFVSSKPYPNAFNDVDLNVIFTHSDGTEITVPAFWNKGNNWMVRFAPVLSGNWAYT
ncbi:MAG: DUF5060 domain-containing protein, partial [Bacteroidales bacterium]|nr:DUF5060 domain-containing protein [Bacteroidales bacterium]